MSRRQRAIGLYVLIAYGFTWTVWLPYLVAVRRGAEPPSPFLYYLAGLGPLLGGVTAAAFERRRYGVQDLLSRLLDWRRAGAGLSLASCRHWRWLRWEPWPSRLGVMAGRVWSDFGITSRAPSLGPLATWLLMTASYGVGEEVGWRGLGAGAVVLTALYNASNGSILVVALWHGSWNWVATSDGLQGPWVAVMTALVMVTAPVVVWRWGPRRLAPRPRAVVPEQTQPEPAFPATKP